MARSGAALSSMFRKVRRSDDQVHIDCVRMLWAVSEVAVTSKLPWEGRGVMQLIGNWRAT